MTIRLEVDADFGDGTRTGVFEQFTNVKGTSDQVRTGYLLNDAANEAIGFLTDLLNEGESEAGGIFLNLGGSTHAITLKGEVTSGEKADREGNTLQWGSSSGDDVTRSSATAGTALQKAQIFLNYIRVSGTDSMNRARLEWGEYSPEGALEDHLDVVFEEPKFERRGPDKYRFSATFVEAAALDDILDGDKQTES